MFYVPTQPCRNIKQNEAVWRWRWEEGAGGRQRRLIWRNFEERGGRRGSRRAEKFEDDNSPARVRDESVKSGWDERKLEEDVQNRLTCKTGGGRRAVMKRRSGWAGELVWCEADQRDMSLFIPPNTSDRTRPPPRLCVCGRTLVWLTSDWLDPVT